MTEHDIICAEIREERISICLDSGIPEKQAELIAWIEVSKFKKQQKESGRG